MKIVIKEWLKNKKACGYLGLYFIVSILDMIVDAQIIILISNVISKPTNSNLLILGAALLIQMVLMIIEHMAKPLASSNCFTTLFNQYSDKILDADFDMFTKLSCASINTASEFCGQVTSVGLHFFGFILNIIGVFVTLFSMYLVAGKYIILVIIVYIIGTILLKRTYKEYGSLDDIFIKAKKERNQNFENVINGFQEVRSFNTADIYRRKIYDFNNEIMDTRVAHAKLNAKFYAILQGADMIGIIFVVIYVITMLHNGSITQAAGMSLIMYVFRLINPLINSLDFLDELSQNLSLSKEYEKVINYVNRDHSMETIELDDFNNEIKLENVSFSYNHTDNTLDNINMTFEKGKKIGICGASGGGKSTIFKLLNRFYVPTSGKITIDGFDINMITNSSYRKHICSVHQENTIFPGSIRSNIVYGVNSYTEDQLMDAIKKSNLYDFIMSLPDKLETEVGPKGLKLSGGQKQRIALARIFMVDPDIILLDEATSALDNESEALIQDSLNNLSSDKTVITIAHRLTTIKDCDIIYVVGNHKVIEQGSHDELMKHQSVYYKMYTQKEKEE